MIRRICEVLIVVAAIAGIAKAQYDRSPGAAEQGSREAWSNIIYAMRHNRPDTPEEVRAKAKVRAEAEAAAWQKRWTENHRTWTDKSGKFTVEAVYDGFTAAYLKVQLLKEDKSRIEVYLTRLSDADRKKAFEFKKAAQLPALPRGLKF